MKPLRLKATPIPARDPGTGRDNGVLGRVRQHVVHSPAHVAAQSSSKRGIGGQFRIIERANETIEKPFAEIAHVAVTGMHPEDAGLVAAGSRVGRRPAHHLGPVSSQTLHVLGMLVVVRKRMVQLGIRETSRMMGTRQSKKRSFPTRELKEVRTHIGSLAHGPPAWPCARAVALRPDGPRAAWPNPVGTQVKGLFGRHTAPARGSCPEAACRTSRKRRQLGTWSPALRARGSPAEARTSLSPCRGGRLASGGRARLNRSLPTAVAFERRTTA
jgi:hypothetical protein